MLTNQTHISSNLFSFSSRLRLWLRLATWQWCVPVSPSCPSHYPSRHQSNNTSGPGNPPRHTPFLPQRQEPLGATPLDDAHLRNVRHHRLFNPSIRRHVRHLQRFKDCSTRLQCHESRSGYPISLFWIFPARFSEILFRFEEI